MSLPPRPALANAAGRSKAADKHLTAADESGKMQTRRNEQDAARW
jgi:hypothetical protein